MNAALIASLILFLCMLVAAEFGVRMGRIQAAKDPHGSQIGVGVIGGAVLSLLGLILAFTFSVSASRLEFRRQLVVQEANAIGTAYPRIDLLPAEDQPAIAEAGTHGQTAAIPVLNAVNEMIDVTTARRVALRTPELITYLMFGLAILGAMTAGYGMSPASKRNWPLTLIFPLAISLAVYVVLDLDNPN